MSSNILAQAQVQLAALKSQAGKSAGGGPAPVTTMAAMQQPMSLPQLRGLTGGLPTAAAAAGLPAGLTLQQAQAAYGLAGAQAAALTDPYLGQSIGPIAGYQNALYRRFAPY